MGVHRPQLGVGHDVLALPRLCDPGTASPPTPTQRIHPLTYPFHLQKQVSHLLEVENGIADFLASQRSVEPRDAPLLARFLSLTASGTDKKGRKAVLRQLNPSVEYPSSEEEDEEEVAAAAAKKRKAPKKVAKAHDVTDLERMLLQGIQTLGEGGATPEALHTHAATQLGAQNYRKGTCSSALTRLEKKGLLEKVEEIVEPAAAQEAEAEEEEDEVSATGRPRSRRKATKRAAETKTTYRLTAAGTTVLGGGAGGGGGGAMMAAASHHNGGGGGGGGGGEEDDDDSVQVVEAPRPKKAKPRPTASSAAASSSSSSSSSSYGGGGGGGGGGGYSSYSSYSRLPSYASRKKGPVIEDGRLKRALGQRFACLSAQLTVGEGGVANPRGVFRVQSSGGDRTYTVTFAVTEQGGGGGGGGGGTVQRKVRGTCSCPDGLSHGGRTVCKHQLFVAIRILGLTPDVLHAGEGLPVAEFAVALSQDRLAHLAAGGAAPPRLPAVVTDTAKAAPQRAVDGESECLVCFEELLKEDGTTDPLSYCRVCGHNVHTACQSQWMRAQARYDSACAYCRSKDAVYPA